MVRADFEALDEVGDHLLAGQGKLLRPTLVLLSSRARGRRPREAVRLAAVVELVHMATLVHDDAVDHSVRRRGMPTVNSQWTHQVAIITGDYLYSRAVTELTDLESVEMMRVLGEAANRMTVGEMRQLVSHEALDFTEEDYERLCRCKTASLISAACELGAMVGAPAHRDDLRDFGEDLGMAFQIVDDLLDYEASPDSTGKPTGLDLREHKVTLPLIRALPRMEPDEREEVEDLFRNPDPDRKQVDRVVDVVSRRGGMEYARSRAEGFARRARRRLDGLPGTPAVRSLRGAAHYVLARRR